MNQIQRVAAYNICLDADDRLLVCRLSALVADRVGWWTLPGGGIEFGEHPEAAAIRELHEETGLTGRIVELLAVDSIRRTVRGPDEGPERGGDYHSVRIIYRTEVDPAELRFETGGSSDLAAWCTRAELAELELVELGRLGVRLAYGDPR